MKGYDRNYNYIGSSDKQKEFTKHIHRKYGRLNFVAYIHDSMYSIILTIENVFLFLICKFFVDLIFLICGVFLNVIRINIFLGLLGIFLTIQMYILILLYTPIYIIKHFYKTKKVRFF